MKKWILVMALLVTNTAFASQEEVIATYVKWDGKYLTAVLTTAGAGTNSGQLPEIALKIMSSESEHVLDVKLDLLEVRPDEDVFVEQSAVTHCYQLDLGSILSTHLGATKKIIRVSPPSTGFNNYPWLAESMCRSYQTNIKVL